MYKFLLIARCSLLLFVSILLIASCGKKEVKKVSMESNMAKEVFALAETMRNAYVKNDRATLERNSTKEGYRELIGAMKSFDSVELTFTPRWVDIEDSVIYLNVSWKGTWVVSGKKTEERGMAIFVLEGKPPKLARVLRANPFKQPE
ncbi:MAG: hypothetical protein FJ242_02065 [Nitrospira sp.]|nr:hypothetical protein [Nitrospira sp.]